MCASRCLALALTTASLTPSLTSTSSSSLLLSRRCVCVSGHTMPHDTGCRQEDLCSHGGRPAASSVASASRLPSQYERQVFQAMKVGLLSCMSFRFHRLTVSSRVIMSRPDVQVPGRRTELTPKSSTSHLTLSLLVEWLSASACPLQHITSS